MKTIYGFRGNYAFLSNFYPCSIVYDGARYTCVESAFQAAKCVDPDVKKNFANRGPWSTPPKAKKNGRFVKLRPDWDQVKDGIMLELLRLKFRDPQLAGLLLGTGDDELVEGNTWNDTYWGVCNGVGKNRLGELLMQVRSELMGG